MLVVISAPKPIANEARLINQLFDAGLKHFHLRKEEMNKADYQGIVTHIDPSYYPRLVLHQFHELAFIYPLQRLHYKEMHRQNSLKSEFSSLKAQGVSLSTSIHDLSYLAELEKFEYVLYGPVHDSLSKSGYLGLSKNKLVLPVHCNRPKLVAIGGVTASNIEQTLALGFEGAALLGAIWNKPDSAVTNFKKIQEIWQNIILS